MNKQKAPNFQEQKVSKTQQRPSRMSDDLNLHDKQSVEEMMRMMESNDDDTYDDEDDIIDAEHDPSVDVTEDYGDDD